MTLQDQVAFNYQVQMHVMTSGGSSTTRICGNSQKSPGVWSQIKVSGNWSATHKIIIIIIKRFV